MYLLLITSEFGHLPFLWTHLLTYWLQFGLQALAARPVQERRGLRVLARVQLKTNARMLLLRANADMLERRRLLIPPH